MGKISGRSTQQPERRNGEGGREREGCRARAPHLEDAVDEERAHDPEDGEAAAGRPAAAVILVPVPPRRHGQPWRRRRHPRRVRHRWPPPLLRTEQVNRNGNGGRWRRRRARGGLGWRTRGGVGPARQGRGKMEKGGAAGLAGSPPPRRAWKGRAERDRGVRRAYGRFAGSIVRPPGSRPSPCNGSNAVQEQKQKGRPGLRLRAKLVG